MKRGFGSDNHSGIHPELFSALANANQFHAPSYGTDEWSEAAIIKFKEQFGELVKVYFVFNGTAANALAITTLAQSFNSVICADSSHLNVDECGAPEFFFGGKLITVKSKNGKISVEQLDELMVRRGDQHFSQVSAISITQPTELGTVYSLTELRDICQWAKKQKLYIHMDGARIANAAVALGIPFKQFTTDLGVDIVSFGGTKNGLIYGEAVVFLNPELGKSFKFQRKQYGQLPSKTRFIAASFQRYLSTGLWQQIAEHSLKMAQLLGQELHKYSEIKITQPIQSNAVFAEIPRTLIKELRDEFFFYIWNEQTFECRLMTSWDTEPDDIFQFSQKINQLLNKRASL